jgi:hypothetical protein
MISGVEPRWVSTLAKDHRASINFHLAEPVPLTGLGSDEGGL